MAAKCEFSLFCIAFKNVQQRYSRDVTVLPQHWLGGKRRVASLRSASDAVAEGSIIGGAMQLGRSGTVLQCDEAS